MSILEVKNLKKNFGSLEVLKGIDFSLEKGEALAMIGASGSGKTTLLPVSYTHLTLPTKRIV